jgi:hypothetical protein
MSQEHEAQAVQATTKSFKDKLSGKVIGIIAGGVILVIAGVGVSIALLTGGGTQPEDVLPRDTVAMAKIDLNPKIGQRINLVRFLSKFPKAIENFDQEDPIGSILEQSEISNELDWAEIQPWIGNRYAAALVESAGELNPVFVFSVKNELEMKYFFNKNYPELDYEVILDYVLIASNKSVLNVITSAPSHLSDNEDYKSDMDTLGGDQIASVWANLKPISKLAEETINQYFYDQGLNQSANSQKSNDGRIAVGMHFTPDSFVTDMITVGVNDGEVNVDSESRSLEIIGDLPSDIFGVLSIDGVGQALTGSLLNNEIGREILGELGISQRDFTLLFEGPLAILSVNDSRKTDPIFIARMEPSNPAQTLAAVKRFLSRNGYYPEDIDSIVSAEGKYIYLGADSESLRSGVSSLKSGALPLRDNEQFKNVLTEPGNLSLFIDLSRFLSKIEFDTNKAPLGALGISVGAESGDSGVSRTKITLSLKSD